jgi:hypothetical protein
MAVEEEPVRIMSSNIGINKSQPTNCDEDNDKDNGKGSLIK